MSFDAISPFSIKACSLREDSITDGWLKPDFVKVVFVKKTNEQQCHSNE
jgi:hypothetical protein